MSELNNNEAVNSAAEKQVELQVLKARAVRQATFEVMGEQKPEIIKRARAKLVAMGVPVEELSDV